MRILILCKRQYTGKDLIDDRYGRLFELPAGLAALGNEVVVATTSYRDRPCMDKSIRGVRWVGINLFPWPSSTYKRIFHLALEFMPDVIVASSDAPHLVLGSRTASRLRVPVVLDYYDDYEAFSLTQIPGLRRALRSASIRATAVTAVTQTLASTLEARGTDAKRLHVLPNGIPANFGTHLNKTEARKRLSLPLDAQLVGTAGALDSSRGIADLFRAVALVQKVNPNVRLVVAGPRWRRLGPVPPGTIDLGVLPHKDVATLFRSLDLGVICNRAGSFSHACHPMKLIELAFIGTPVVAADVGEVARLLRQNPRSLYTPGNAVQLAEQIAQQLTKPSPLDTSLAESWDEIAFALSSILNTLTTAR
jgi:glycosyltransferase involved in cell wall biosynthesis